MPVYYWITKSIAAPFFSDTDNGFVEAPTAMEALKKIVEGYNHPCGLYAAVIKSCETQSKVLARYLSAKATTTEKAEKMEGAILKEGNKIFVGDKEVTWEKERWENFEEGD